MQHTRRRIAPVLAGWAALAAVAALAADTPTAGSTAGPAHANVLLITVDTLRPDRLSGYGYGLPTSPHVDRLTAAGARFAEARTVEPLTNPALSSMLTGLYPHEHGATRNGLRLRARLPSLPGTLAEHGYLTAAFVANWTLKDRISGLAEHFGHFGEVFTRKRWFGLIREEADAGDVNDAALAWLEANAGRRRPFFAWVHYVEPHAPYLFHGEYAGRLGIDPRGGVSKSDRYDTEVAFVDAAVGEVLSWLEARPEIARDTLVVFTSDHGESLGEHGDWGHGRTLYEPALRIPLSLTWPGKISPQVVDAPASLIDLPSTVLGLVGLPLPETFRGLDWSAALAGRQPADGARTTFHQAHRGAVLNPQEARQARRGGLLEVGLVGGRVKEVLRLPTGEHRRFELDRDPGERRDRGGDGRPPSPELAAWRAAVDDGLANAPDLPEVDIDPESAERLRSLGYLD